MNTKYVINGQITLYSYIDHDTVERVCITAVLPAAMAQDWEGQSLNVIDWKIDPEAKTVFATYQTRNDVYAPILDATLALGQERYKLRPPTKSRNWRLLPNSEQWQNTKTGERAYA